MCICRSCATTAFEAFPSKIPHLPAVLSNRFHFPFTAIIGGSLAESDGLRRVRKVIRRMLGVVRL